MRMSQQKKNGSIEYCLKWNDESESKEDGTECTKTINAMAAWCRGAFQETVRYRKYVDKNPQALRKQ